MTGALFQYSGRNYQPAHQFTRIFGFADNISQLVGGMILISGKRLLKPASSLGYAEQARRAMGSHSR
jgi:hypothetical protein